MGKLYDKPDISIITISFNNNHLDETVNSILSLKQRSKSHIEHVLINGGNHVRESSVVDIYVNESDSGIYDALNKGLDKASGRFVMFVHGDDYVDPSFNLDLILENLDSSKNVDIYLGRTYINSFPGRFHGSFLWRPFLLRAHIQPPHLSAVYKSCLFDNFRFNDEYRIISDFLMFSHFSKKSFKYSRTRIIVQSPNGLSSSIINVTKEFSDIFGLKAWLFMPFRLAFKLFLGWL